MLTGLNHLTLSVTNLPRSVEFYESLLGFRLEARWVAGAYLSLGGLWLCLSLDERRPQVPHPEYTHYAFGIAQADFAAFTERLLMQGVEPWKANSSEGDSFYFLDPDGHRLEVHVGDLASRLAQCRVRPYEGMWFAEGSPSGE